MWWSCSIRISRKTLHKPEKKRKHAVQIAAMSAALTVAVAKEPIEITFSLQVLTESLNSLTPFLVQTDAGTRHGIGAGICSEMCKS